MSRPRARLARLESLRQAEEGSRRVSLALALAALDVAAAAVPERPGNLAEASFDAGGFRGEMSRLRLEWASVGAGMGRVEAARSGVEQARREWSASAVALRSVQRLGQRERLARRAERSRRDRRDLDEASLVSWGRRHG